MESFLLLLHRPVIYVAMEAFKVVLDSLGKLHQAETNRDSFLIRNFVFPFGPDPHAHVFVK